jgi:hypothetical protein
MTTPLSFDDLQGILPRHIEPLPDSRKKGPHTRSRIPDAALGAFGLFLTPAPSFLESQRRRQHTQGHKNAHTLLGVEQIPCDHQSRKRLDPLAPSARAPVFVAVFERLEQPHMLAPCRGLDNPLLVALDGPNYFSSPAIHCHPWLTRPRTNGHTLSYHAALTPVIVCPGQSQVIALPPAYILPQDGHAKQDCERAAGQRWLTTHAARVAPHGGTFLGDELYSNQPVCALGLHNRCHFILTCQPDSPPTCYERVAFWQATASRAERAGRRGNGRCTEGTQVRSSNDVLLRGGDDAWSVHGCDITVVKATTGEQL